MRCATLFLVMLMMACGGSDSPPVSGQDGGTSGNPDGGLSDAGADSGPQLRLGDACEFVTASNAVSNSRCPSMSDPSATLAGCWWSGVDGGMTFCGIECDVPSTDPYQQAPLNVPCPNKSAMVCRTFASFGGLGLCWDVCSSDLDCDSNSTCRRGACMPTWWPATP